MVYVLAALAAFFYGACCLMLGYMLSAKQTKPLPIKLPKIIKAMEQSTDPAEENKIRAWENIDNYGTNKPQRDFIRGDK